MVKVISRVAFAAVCMLALAAFTQQAKATPTDFSCGSSTCTGTFYTLGGGNYSGVGIDLLAGTWNLPGPNETGATFELVFNTSSDTVSLTDTANSSIFLSGTIESVLTLGNAIDLNVNWTAPPGYSTENGFIEISTANINDCAPGPNVQSGGCGLESVDLSVAPSPEPASLLLLGTGLLGMGAFVRRRLIG